MTSPSLRYFFLLKFDFSLFSPQFFFPDFFSSTLRFIPLLPSQSPHHLKNDDNFGLFVVALAFVHNESPHLWNLNSSQGK